MFQLIVYTARGGDRLTVMTGSLPEVLAQMYSARRARELLATGWTYWELRHV